MENQGRDKSYKAGHDHQMTGQAQMRNDDFMNQESRDARQNTGFIQKTGEGVMSMTQGAVQGAASVAQGAAVGAANIAQGAASAVKNTLGINNDNTNDHPSNNPNRNTLGINTDNSSNTNFPRNPNTKI